ncbi:hypothetical protein [Sulfurovum sp.]|uniref:hypothetical protein n=1 Tax=Sulfurovum sp. TaxID=1969726 RepID=UPI003563263B
MPVIENDNQTSVEFKYGENRLIGLIFRILAILIGLFLLQVNELWVNFFAFVLILFGSIGFVDMLLFDSLTFFNGEVIKKWHLLGSKRILVSELAVGRTRGIFGGGTIMFWEKGNRLKHAFFMGIDTLPFSHEDLKSMRNLLIKFKVITGDELLWNDFR